MDQSTWVTGSTGPGRLTLARSLLAGGDHGGASGLALGDARVGALREELFERRFERPLVEGDVGVGFGGGGSGGSGGRRRRGFGGGLCWGGFGGGRWCGRV